MEKLINSQGMTNGYQLTQIDLSQFTQIDDSVSPSSNGEIAFLDTVESGDVPVHIITFTEE